MSRNWVLLGLLALASAAGLMALREATPPSTVPWTPLVPSQAIQPATQPAVPTPTPPATSVLQEEDGPPPRVLATVGAAADTREACVHVRVEQVLGAASRRLPFVEVVLQCGDTQLTARTGADGMAEFELIGADGQEATVSCLLGAQAKLTMSAAAPVDVVLTIRPRVIVRGSVVDAAGTPIPEASIVWLPWQGLGNDAPAPWRIGKSAADGSYEVAMAIGGRLGAQHLVYGPSAMYLVQLTATANATPTAMPPVVTLPLVLLARPGQVSGFVRDHTGQPVAGAELEFRHAGKAPAGAELAAVPQRVRSDERGAYVVTRLLPGSITFAARARGHGPQAGEMVLAPGKTTWRDIELPQACAVTGTVRDAEGAPVPAMLIAGTPGEFLAAVAHTAADGSYRLDDLAPGPTNLLAKATLAKDRRLRQETAALELRAGVPSEWHATLAAAEDTANLRGRLVDERGRALARWRVCARPDGGGLMWAEAADDGRFAMTVPPALRVDLRAFAPGTALVRFADAVLRDVDPANGEVEFVVQPIAPGQVLGRIETYQQAPVPASIGCYHHERAEYVRFQATADGIVHLKEIPPGTIDLRFEHPGYAGAERRELTITARQRLELGTVVLGTGGTMHGSVRGPDGQAPKECELIVVSRDETGRSQRFPATYGAGAYRFPTLPVGKHTLLVQGPWLAATAYPITIEVNVDQQLDIALDAGVRRRVLVVIPPGAPGAVGLAFQNTSQVQWLATGGVQQDPTTTRTMPFVAFLAPGDYEAMAWATGYEAKQTVRFVEGNETPIRLELQPKPPASEK